MNLVTELENELVYALLVEQKSAAAINSENALILIDKVKAALQPGSVNEKEKPANLPAGKRLNFFSQKP
jgi:hypothetical protein